MKKLIVALLGSLCVLLTSNVDAQPSAKPTSLRGIAVSSMLDYGQALFERRNYKGAIPVLERILAYDPYNAKARDLLNMIAAMGFKVNIPPMPKMPETPKAQPKAKPEAKSTSLYKEAEEPQSSTFTIEKPYFGRVGKKNIPDVKKEEPKEPVVPAYKSEPKAELEPETYMPSTVATSESGAIEDLAQLQNDLRTMRLSLEEQADKLNDLEQQLP